MNKLKINKKAISLILAGAIGLGGISLNKTVAEGNKTYIMTTTKVNLRTDSNTDSKIITTLNNGDIIESVTLLPNGWYEVIYNGQTAYICGDYVTPLDNSIEKGSNIVIANDNVRVRSTNSTDGEILGLLEKGDSLQYVGTTSNGWYEVKYKGNTAYISSDYADLSKEELQVEKKNIIIANTSVNIRELPTTDSRKLGLLNEDNSLEFIRKLDNNWYEVLYDGGYAYISGEFVRESTKDVVGNKVYKLVSMKEDSTIYKDKYFTEPLCDIPKYELANVLCGGDSYYLVTSENGSGYIKRGVTENLGDVAVVVDVSSQLLTLYKDAEPFHTASVVTGKNSMPTDIGLFQINRKMRDYYMSSYDVFVSFWMPFSGDQGLHDASWRKEFGGNIYKKNGSHGCINLPYETAETVYNNVKKGTKVLVKN